MGWEVGVGVGGNRGLQTAGIGESKKTIVPSGSSLVVHLSSSSIFQ